MGTSIVPRPGLAFLVTVLGYALIGAAVDLIAALGIDLPSPPPGQSDGVDP